MPSQAVGIVFLSSAMQEITILFLRFLFRNENYSILTSIDMASMIHTTIPHTRKIRLEAPTKDKAGQRVETVVTNEKRRKVEKKIKRAAKGTQEEHSFTSVGAPAICRIDVLATQSPPSASVCTLDPVKLPLSRLPTSRCQQQPYYAFDDTGNGLVSGQTLQFPVISKGFHGASWLDALQSCFELLCFVLLFFYLNLCLLIYLFSRSLPFSRGLPLLFDCSLKNISSAATPTVAYINIHQDESQQKTRPVEVQSPTVLARSFFF